MRRSNYSKIDVRRIQDEIRATSETGASKGQKPERYSLLPVEALAEVARVYNYGSQKYGADHQYRTGYPYSWSYDALLRHINRFWAGEDIDESGHHHLAHAAFHLLTMMTFQKEGKGTDDRFKL